MQQLVSLAYGVSVTQILDAPSWIRTEAYDVTAGTGRSTPSIVGRQVVDRTGLGGIYDWDRSWTPTPGEPGPRSESAAPGDGVLIFAAVQEQLGLKLEAQRGVIDALVIDRIERPTSN